MDKNYSDSSLEEKESAVKESFEDTQSSNSLMTKEPSVPVVYEEPESYLIPHFQSSPERGLLAAVLERAFRDLGVSDQQWRSHAIWWFRTGEKIRRKRMRKTKLYSFTFSQIAEELDLSGMQIDFIMKKVEEAEKRPLEDLADDTTATRETELLFGS